MYNFFVVGVKCDLFGIKQKIMNWWMRFREMNIYCMISERRILNVKAKWKKINWELNAERRCSGVYCFCSFSNSFHIRFYGYSLLSFFIHAFDIDTFLSWKEQLSHLKFLSSALNQHHKQSWPFFNEYTWRCSNSSLHTHFLDNR